MKPKKILEFKTNSPFYEMCRDGEKPFDIRKINPHDPRFRALSQIRHKENPQWVIKFVHPTGASFMRWLSGWDHIKNQYGLLVKPEWAILYLGELYENHF